jgi:hypothetical protein
MPMLFPGTGFQDDITRFFRSDIRLLVIDILADHVGQLLGWNIGHNVENFLFEILRCIDGPFIGCPVHIVSFHAADLGEVRSLYTFIIMPALPLLFATAWPLSENILAFELAYVQYIDCIKTILYRYVINTSDILLHGTG